MIALALLGALTLGPGGVAKGDACLPATPQPGPGVADPFRAPAEEATRLNADAKVLYRRGKWEEARAQYRAAEAADPDFLAPRLNVACSFVRQERFDEAVAEVKGLLERAFIPWSREILEAADLGALKVHPQMAEVNRALAAGAAAWGAGLDESVIFVGRLRAPLRIPADGAGEFILNPHQEVFAFTPATGRFRQLTAEDGHVVAVAVSPDRRLIAYVTAEKLVRGPKADAVTLDGVALGEIALPTLRSIPLVRIPGAVRRIEISGARTFMFQIDGERLNGLYVLDDARRELTLLGRKVQLTRGAVVVSASGAAPATATVPGACPIVARDTKAAAGRRAIQLSLHGRPARTIGGEQGAGLAGLPLP
ncbi:MAG TPA: hypothetical protein VGP64_15775 [Polyangia bacterium]|jgi:hypothetical protein